MNTFNILKVSFVSVSLLATASFGQVRGNSSVGTEGPQEVTVKGDDAKTIEGILNRAELPVPTVVRPVIGYTKVAADSVSCSRVVVPGAIAKCVVSKKVDDYQAERTLSNEDADKLFLLLTQYVGLRSPKEVGYGVSYAVTRNIVCGHPVVLNPVTTCTILKAPALAQL